MILEEKHTRIYNTDTKHGLINWLRDDFIIAYHPTTDEKIRDVEAILSKKNYDELYRLANMVDRFGWEAIFESSGLVRNEIG